MPEKHAQKKGGGGGGKPLSAQQKLRIKLNAEARRHGHKGVQSAINDGDLAFGAEEKRAGFKPPEKGSMEWKSMKKHPHHYLNIQLRDKSSPAAADRKRLRIKARQPSSK